jgi:16S rRNA (adenine1518-N6/adenine1519-N6)-dimethyltransferase
VADDASLPDPEGDPGGGTSLLTASLIRELANELGIRPTKRRGQNFVIDANTVRRIVRLSEASQDDVVLEVGPGLGSLTLALLAAGPRVVAVEIDAVLAQALPHTVARFAAGSRNRLIVVEADALAIDALPLTPSVLVANLPYNVAVPVVLHLLERFPSIGSGLVMVQREVAERLSAPPGTRSYGVPSAKAAWYALVRQQGKVSRSVFWPVPNVDSGLVAFHRRPPPQTTATRKEVFACIDAAFAQRRKSLRGALAEWAGSREAAARALLAAGIDPLTRGERLSIADFAAVTENRFAGRG